MFRYANQLLKRFSQTLQSEGIRPALAKSIEFIRRSLAASAPSTVSALIAPASDGDPQVKLWRHLAETQSFHPLSPPIIGRTHPRIALIGDLNLPQCSKYRVEQMAELCDLAGARLSYVHYTDTDHCWDLLQDATHLMQYRLPHTPETQRYHYEARRLKLPVAYDIDDPIFSVSAYASYSNSTHWPGALLTHFMSEAPRYLDMMDKADLLVGSTPGLLDHMAEYSPRPTALRRNFADQQTLAAGAKAMRPLSARHEHAMTIGFVSGSQGHEADLLPILPAIAATLGKNPDHKLCIIGHFDMKTLPPNVAEQTIHTPFMDYPSYLAALAACDVMVAPLTDDIFNRCKSAVRQIDANAAGVACIASQTGDYEALTLDRQTGMIAHTLDDWRAALAELEQDPALRARMGHAARAHLETHWRAATRAHVVSDSLLNWIRS